MDTSDYLMVSCLDTVRGGHFVWAPPPLKKNAANEKLNSHNDLKVICVAYFETEDYQAELALYRNLKIWVILQVTLKELCHFNPLKMKKKMKKKHDKKACRFSNIVTECRLKEFIIYS